MIRKPLAMGVALFMLGSALGVGVSFATQMNFSDVKPSDWFYNDVQNMVTWDVIRGNPDGTFRPGATVNRAELSAMWNRYNAFVAKNYYTRSEVDALLTRVSEIPSATAPTTSNNTPAAQVDADGTKTVAMNTTATLNGVSITVKSLTPHIDDLFTPKAGYKFLAADITIKNESGRTIGINSATFSIKDADGFVYGNAVARAHPDLPFDDLESGKEVRGFAVFEVSSSATLKEMSLPIDYGKLGKVFVSL